MKGREGNYKGGSAHSADLLVCFPSRAHLALTPKPICSPARLSDSQNRRHNNHRGHLCKLSGSQASPLLWTKPTNKQMGSAEISEPTSPKVTCAGQIKVRPSNPGGPNTCKNWQSVMEEIERIHNSRSQSKFFGFKKDVMNFLTCLRNIRFDCRCLGSFPQADITSDDEEDDEDNEFEQDEEEGEEESSRTVFSKWLMVLQENQSDNDHNNNGFSSRREKKQSSCDLDDVLNGDSDAEPAVPPPNALLLMRCRSAPARSWLEEKKAEKELKDKRERELENSIREIDDDGREEGEEEEEEEEEKEKDQRKKKKKDLRSLMEEETMNLVVMRYDTDFYRLSADIAKETWVVGGIKDPLSRSRSWRR